MMLLPLFEAFPILENQLPWVRIIDKPTPIQQLKQLQTHLHTDTAIWVKLDNLTSEKYGGNKVRKLEFILADALQQKKHCIATIGGLGTNHGLATTIHGATQKLKTRVYLRKQPITPQVLQNLLLLHYYGADLILVKNRYTTGVHFNLVDRFLRSSTYWLPVGGSTPIGVLGYVNAVFELKHQILKGLLPEPRWIFVPVGSVGTIAGIELGLQLSGLKSRVKGICVTPNHKNVPRTLHKLISQTRALLKAIPELEHFQYRPRYELSAKFIGSGYGHPTQAGEEATLMASEYAQLTLDPTYTAKTFAAVLDYLRQEHPGPILYWHTLNSANLTSIAEQVDYLDLPKPFHRFFEPAN
ncbi:MAG: 1-aminocyclopropane-1-carboxylate deaminase/D-cysteine desulfhydrase [Candidatus Thorarchaeota archaeon]